MLKKHWAIIIIDSFVSTHKITREILLTRILQKPTMFLQVTQGSKQSFHICSKDILTGLLWCGNQWNGPTKFHAGKSGWWIIQSIIIDADCMAPSWQILLLKKKNDSYWAFSWCSGAHQKSQWLSPQCPESHLLEPSIFRKPSMATCPAKTMTVLCFLHAYEKLLDMSNVCCSFGLE